VFARILSPRVPTEIKALACTFGLVKPDLVASRDRQPGFGPGHAWPSSAFGNRSKHIGPRPLVGQPLRPSPKELARGTATFGLCEDQPPRPSAGQPLRPIRRATGMLSSSDISSAFSENTRAGAEPEIEPWTPSFVGMASSHPSYTISLLYEVSVSSKEQSKRLHVLHHQKMFKRQVMAPSTVYKSAG